MTSTLPCAAFLLLFILPASTVVAQTVADRTTAEREAGDFAQSLDAALRAKDKAALERATDDTFEFIHSTGRLEDRTSFIQRAAAGQLAAQRNPGEILSNQIRVAGDTAIRTTRTAVQMDPNDAKAPPTQFYTRYVYVKSAGAWRWLSAQSTIVTPAVAATIR